MINLLILAAAALGGAYIMNQASKTPEGSFAWRPVRYTPDSAPGGSLLLIAGIAIIAYFIIKKRW
jgi:hypothetical protein